MSVSPNASFFTLSPPPLPPPPYGLYLPAHRPLSSSSFTPYLSRVSPFLLNSLNLLFSPQIQMLLYSLSLPVLSPTRSPCLSTSLYCLFFPPSFPFSSSPILQLILFPPSLSILLQSLPSPLIFLHLQPLLRRPLPPLSSRLSPKEQPITFIHVCVLRLLHLSVSLFASLSLSKCGFVLCLFVCLSFVPLINVFFSVCFFSVFFFVC